MVDYERNLRQNSIQFITHCELGEPIGEGASATVLHGKRYISNDMYGTDVAIKYIDLRKFGAMKNLDRFINQIDTWLRINSGEYIVPIIDAKYVENECIVIVMGEVKGPTIRQSLKEGVWQIYHAMNLLRRLCTAVRSLHDKQVAHCDIHPSNIMLKSELDRFSPNIPGIVLLDFELAAARDMVTRMSWEQSISQDIRSIMSVFRYVLWENDDIKADETRGITKELAAFVKRVIDHNPYKSIDDFEIAFIDVMQLSRQYIKQEIGKLGSRRVDSQFLDFFLFEKQYIGQTTQDTQEGLPTIKEDERSDAPTEPVAPDNLRQKSNANTSEVRSVPIDTDEFRQYEEAVIEGKNQAEIITQTQTQVHRVVETPHLVLLTQEFQAIKFPAQQSLTTKHVELPSIETQPIVRGALMMGAAACVLFGLVWLFLGLAHPPAPFAPQDGVLMSVANHRVVLINIPDGRQVYEDPRYTIDESAYSSDGRYLAAENMVFDRASGMFVMRVDSVPNPVAVALNHDGSILALHDGVAATLWDVHTNQLLYTLPTLNIREVGTLFTEAGHDRLQRALQAAWQ